METEHAQLKMFRTTVLGVGPFVIEFPDGEMITMRTEQRQKEIVDAVNSHDALKAENARLLGLAHGYLRYLEVNNGWNELKERVRKIISEVEAHAVLEQVKKARLP